MYKRQEVDGKSYIADKDKAEQFAKTYRGFSRLPRREKEDKEGKRVDREIKRRPNVVRKQTRHAGELENSERDITRVEVMRVIKDSSNNKAAGMDDIPYAFRARSTTDQIWKLVQEASDNMTARGREL